MTDSILAFSSVYQAVNSHLDEKTRRLVLGAMANHIGRGGPTLVNQFSGVSREVITRGQREIRGEMPLPEERTRIEGGGRKAYEDKHPEVIQTLKGLLDSATRGDPEAPLLYTSKSLANLVTELKELGYSISDQTVRKLLLKLGYTLQANKKVLEGKSSHPDRDAQFQHIGQRTTDLMTRGQPVISVDTKKKELIGQYSNKGVEWHPKGQPERTLDHDFGTDRVSPFGIYDETTNEGFVNVGTDGDTAAFAVESIRRWWNTMGAERYPNAKEILITADCGGSNGYRTRLWKSELQDFANETGLAINVCHFPPGTSKWNKIEHRLFSHISMNWRNQPLVSHEVIVNLIASTKTSTGLSVSCELDRGEYPRGQKVSDKQMEMLHLERHDFHGEWNYCIRPL